MTTSSSKDNKGDSKEVEFFSIEGQATKTEPAAEPADVPRKKRYFSPNEVMKKKGCIGCGGMVLSLVLLAAGLVAVLVVL
jgi:hypothetical protein